MTKWVYAFGAELAEGSGEMKNLLGGKGANLAEMASLGRNLIDRTVQEFQCCLICSPNLRLAATTSR